MSGITSGTGVFSGINSAQIIDQLIAVESRPKALIQRRIVQLQQQQAGYLDLNSKLSALRTAASQFRTNRVMQSAAATSTNSDVLAATASAGAPAGSYQFLVDRLVSTQQMLSRGFANSNSTGIGAGSWTVESAVARLDRDTNLSDLNGGAGVQRGRITISSSGGGSATVDLSKAATVNEVLEAINSATGVSVRARVEGGRFVISSGDGSNLTIASANGGQTAESLGIRTTTAAATVNGEIVYRLTNSTSLASLNDGNGVFLNSQTGSGRFDFQIVVGSTTVKVNLGDETNAQGTVTAPAVTSLGGAVERINKALKDSLGNEDMKVAISSDGSRLVVTDSQNRTYEVQENSAIEGATTARDLGLLTSAPVTGTLNGQRILAGMNSTLARTLNGGTGVGGTGAVSITARSGATFTVNVDRGGSVSDILQAFERDTGGVIRAELDRNGTGILVRDTSTGTGSLIITGATAEALKISTGADGVAAALFDGGNVQRQYITRQTQLASLRNGQGVGQGTFRITDSNNRSAVVTIGESAKTLDDVIKNINSRDTRVKARINDTGDGILLFEDGPGGGTGKIKVEDESGSVATNLNLKGTAAGTGVQNVINGTFEKTITFAATDTLEQVVTKFNSAGVGMSAAIVNDGSGVTPFRLNLTSRATGVAGRMVVDTGTFDLGAQTLDEGRDARVFFGSSDPARAVLLTSSRNTLDRVVPGVTIDLKGTSQSTVTVNVTRDASKIEEQVNTLVTTANTLLTAIANQTKVDPEANRRAALAGDSTAAALRQGIYSIVNDRAIGVSGQFQRLADIGIRVGKSGQLEFNRERFRQALETDPEAVSRLLTAREAGSIEPIQVAPGITVNNTASAQVTVQGVFTRMEELAEQYLNSVDGRLTRRDKAIKDQIDAQTGRVRSIDTRLAGRRQILEQQFLRMERAIGQLQGQQSSLGQIQQIG